MIEKLKVEKIGYSYRSRCRSRYGKKKESAYAHSLNRLNLGIKISIP